MQARWLAPLFTAPFVVAACSSGSGGSSEAANGGAPNTSDAGATNGANAADVASATASAPVLSALSPPSVAAGAHAFSLTLVGTGFTARTTVQVDGSVIASTFVDAEHLRIFLPDDLLSTGGMLHISTATAPPGGGTSAEIDLAVDNASPTLASIAPMSATAGQGDVQLTVEGGAFAANAVVDLDGSPLATVVFSSGQLAATVPAGMVTTAGAHDVTVVNPMPGGGTTTSLAFTVTDAAATLTGVTPARVFAGAADTVATVSGTGFLTGSSCLFNGVSLAATRVDAGHLQVTIPASSLAVAGDMPLSVVGPFAGDSPSVPLVFHVDFGAPMVDSFVPGVIASGSGDTVVTIHGEGFASGASVTFDSQSAATTYVDTTEITAVLPQAIAATTHDVQVIVTTPAPGGGTSKAALLPVRGESPDIVAIAPTGAYAGAPDTVVTLTGASFLPTSIVDFDGAALATTYVSGTTIRATIPAADLLTPAAHTVVVDNGAAGASASAPFAVTCDVSAADAVLTSIGAATSFTIDWTNAGAAVTPITTTGAGVCPSTAGTGAAQPVATYVVVNDTPATASLEAWAVCGVGGIKNDAFLTMYNSSSVPSTDAERLACTGSIAEGASGYGGFSSPEANTNKYCPGLTAANSGALSLPACGRAVVLLQPWDVTSTTYPPPSTVRVDLR